MLARHDRPLGLALVTALLMAIPAQVIGQDLDDVVRQREQLQGEVKSAMEDLESLEARIDEAQRSVEEFEAERAGLVDSVEQSRKALQDRARTMYVTGRPDPFFLMMTSSLDEFSDRLSLVSILDRRDQASLEQASNAIVRLEQVNELLEARQDELSAALQEQQTTTARLQEQLDSTALLEQDLRSRQERQQMIERGVQQGIYSCIFNPSVTQFIDSWGYPRSGGRRHKGTDVMAPRSANVHAFTDGRISRLKTGGLGGIVAYLQGDDGVRYYYAHLEGYVDGLRVGQRVEAGELIAFNGDSGNARGGATHVHFQVHPGGGGPVNPYPWLRAVC